MKKKILVIMLVIVMIMTFIPVLAMTASAAEAVTYVDRYWDETSKSVISTTKSVSDYTVITSGTKLYTGWCVVNSSVVFSSTVYFQDAHLILVDGVTFTAPKIEFGFSGGASTSSLTVYGQTSGTGKILLTPDSGCALNIPENTHLIVNGGGIGATAGLYGAGIGGDNTSTKLGELTVNGGTITAKGGEYGAGIGIGYKDLEKHLEITINGGDVTAIGGKCAPGISTGIGATVTINGGIVKATGGERGAGIGSRATTQQADNGEDAGDIVINGGDITAKGGLYGAGIGSGGYDGDNGSTVINGGLVNATGGNYAAGIGGGEGGNGGTISISGGTVVATSKENGAGIGGGNRGNATVSITGGTITATGGQFGVGIGNGASATGEGSVIISGGTITATGGQHGVGIGNGAYATGEGSVAISGGTITATGGQYGAGIGSAYLCKYDADIVITGGTITAIGGEHAAGIGTGYSCQNGGKITISGGTITANGGYRAAGVGTGYSCHNGVNIVITGGSLKATKGDLADNDVGGGQFSPANDPPSNGTSTVSLKTLTIQDVNEATAITSVNGLSGYGMKDVSTDGDGKLYLYLPNDTSLPESITIGENEFYSDGTGKYTTHQHSFTYVANGATITATCQNTDGQCTNTNGGTAIIMTENTTYTGSEIKNATVIYNDWVGAKDLEIIYENNTNVGTATASITVGGVSASMAFSIEKADLTESDFTVSNTNPTYAYNSTHEVAVLLPVGLDAQYVKVGYSQGGTILTDLPKNAGTYDVSISVVGSPNYNDAFFQNKWQLVIEPKEAIVTVGALGTEEYFFNGYPHTPTVILDLGVLPAPSTEFEGCTVTYENNTQVGTAKVIVGGNYKGEATFVIQKGKPTIGLTSPLDKVMPGYVLTLTPTTNAIDNSYYTTTFTIEDGEGYSVDGFKITIDSGVAVNDVITIKVKSTETATYQAATGELKLTVGVPTADTSDLKTQIDDLQTQLDELSDDADTHATKTALDGAINELQGKLDTLKGTVDTLDTSVDTNTADIIKLSQDIGMLTSEINTLKTLVDKVDALEAADVDLQKAIDENADNIEALADELSDKYTELKDIIGTLPAEYTTVSAYIDAVKTDLDKKIDQAKEDITKAYEKAIEDATAELNKTIADGDKVNAEAIEKAITDLTALIQKAEQAAADADKALKSELEATITNAKDEITKAYEKAIEDATAELNKTIADGDKANAEAIEKAVTDLKALIDMAEQTALAGDITLDGKITASIAKAETELKAAKDELEELISDVQANLNNAKGELDKAISDLDAAVKSGDKELSEKIEALNAALDDAREVLEKADADNKAALVELMNEADEALDAAVKQIQKNLEDVKAALEKADADNKAALEAKDLELEAKDRELTETTNDLKTFIIVVCVIASVALAGCGAFVIWFFIDRKKI